MGTIASKAQQKRRIPVKEQAGSGIAWIKYKEQEGIYGGEGSLKMHVNRRWERQGSEKYMRRSRNKNT